MAPKSNTVRAPRARKGSAAEISAPVVSSAPSADRIDTASFSASGIKAAVVRGLSNGVSVAARQGPTNDETNAPKGLSEAGIAKVKAMLKDDKLAPILTADDQSFTQAVVDRAYTEVVREGGYFDLKEKLDASKKTLTGYVYEFAMRAERAHEDKTTQSTAVRAAYYDALVEDAQKKAQLAERKQRPERDADGKLNDRQTVVPVKELLGDHWVTTVSKFRGALIQGFLPSEFLNGSAFMKAGKQGRKTGGTQNQTTSHSAGASGSSSAPQVGQLAAAAGYGPLTAAALQHLLDAIKECDIEADIQSAQILVAATQSLVLLSAGTYTPAEQDDDIGAKAAANG